MKFCCGAMTSSMARNCTLKRSGRAWCRQLGVKTRFKQTRSGKNYCIGYVTSHSFFRRTIEELFNPERISIVELKLFSSRHSRASCGDQKIIRQLVCKLHTMTPRHTPHTYLDEFFEHGELFFGFAEENRGCHPVGHLHGDE